MKKLNAEKEEFDQELEIEYKKLAKRFGEKNAEAMLQISGTHKILENGDK